MSGTRRVLIEGQHEPFQWAADTTVGLEKELADLYGPGTLFVDGSANTDLRDTAIHPNSRLEFKPQAEMQRKLQKVVDLLAEMQGIHRLLRGIKQRVADLHEPFLKQDVSSMIELAGIIEGILNVMIRNQSSSLLPAVVRHARQTPTIAHDDD